MTTFFYIPKTLFVTLKTFKKNFIHGFFPNKGLNFEKGAKKRRF